MGRYLTLPRFGREESLLFKVIFFLLDPWRIQTAQYNGSIQVYIMDVYIIIIEISVFGNGLPIIIILIQSHFYLDFGGRDGGRLQSVCMIVYY